MTGRTLQCALVGAWHRPPAAQVLRALAVGTPLDLRRASDNSYDSAAVEVWLLDGPLQELVERDCAGDTALRSSLAQDPDVAAELFEDFADLDEFQLGFLGASPKLIEAGQVGVAWIAEALDGGQACEASLTLSVSGKPSVLVRLKDLEAPQPQQEED